MDTSFLCYKDDPRPRWFAPKVRVNARVQCERRGQSRLLRYLRLSQPDAILTRIVYLNVLVLAASALPRLAGIGQKYFWSVMTIQQTSHIQVIAETTSGSRGAPTATQMA